MSTKRFGTSTGNDINLSHKCILVTGGAGFVGSNLVNRMLELDVEAVHIIDNLLSSERANIPSDRRIIFTEGSVSDDSVLTSIADDYDFVFHLSTYHGNQNSIYDPIADHENNLLTTLKLFQHIRSFSRIKKVVYSGAGCAVAEKTSEQAHATREDAPISLVMDSPYSISKMVGEFYAVYYFNQYQLPIVRARFQNVYGPGEILGAGRWRGTAATVWRNVIPTFIYKALKKLTLPLEGGGEATRDFIFVRDIVVGLLLCATRGRLGDVYNLATGAETSILELATIINALTKNPTQPSVMPRRTWDHSGKRFGDPSKALRELGFEANTSLQEGLQITVEWTRSNIDLIDKTIAKHQ